MKKEIVIAIVLVAVLILVFALFGGLGSFLSVFTPELSAGSIIQYTSNPQTTWFTSRNLVFSQTGIIKTAYSTFKFQFETFEGDVYDQTIGGYYGKSCYYRVKVYKDNSLIEEIKDAPWQVGHSFGSSVPHINEMIERAYADDGTIVKDSRTLPNGKSGIEVQFDTEKYSRCSLKSDYKLILPDNLVDINIEQLKENYLVGETISFITNVKNNYNFDIPGVLNVVYVVPSIFGPVQKIDSRQLTIHPGENKIDYNVSINQPVSSLNVTPSLEVYFPTDSFSGVNIIFEGDGQRAYSYRPSFLFGVERENTKELKITNVPIYVNVSRDCRDLEMQCPSGYDCDKTNGLCTKIELIGCSVKGCPEGFSCDSRDVCLEIKKTDYSLLFIGGIIAAVILTIIFVVYRIFKISRY